MAEKLEERTSNEKSIPFALKGKMPIFFAFELLSKKEINYLIQVYENDQMTDIKGQIKVDRKGNMYFFGFRDQQNKKDDVLRYLAQGEKELLVINLDNTPIEAKGFSPEDYFALSADAYNREFLSVL